MIDDGTLSSAELLQITGKQRAHAQAAWFREHYNVELPTNSERVIISRVVFEMLQAKQLGLTTEPLKPARPAIHAVRLAHKAA